MVKAFVKNKSAKTLTLSYSTSLKVVINKKDITDKSADFNYSIRVKNFLSSKDIKKLKAEKTVQIDFAGKGKLDGVDKVTIKYRVGTKLAGKKVTVYEYKNGKLVKIAKGKVSASGFASFKTDHYGQFVIAVE